MKLRSNPTVASALATAVALALPVAVPAAEPSFNYVELNYINVDADLDQTISDGIDTLSFKTKSDSGLQFAGSMEFGGNWHVFGEYAQAGQDLDVSGIIDGSPVSGSGSFDLVRYRFGLGYAHEMSESAQLYGRLSLDGIEANDFRLDGEDLGDSDDDGYGAEVGILWAATPALHMQAQVRYSSVGKLETEGNDEFGSDFLYGLSGRWYFSDAFALQAGYEAGDVSTWHAGVRFSF